MLPLANHQPRTLDEAAELLLDALAPDERDRLRAVPDPEDLIPQAHLTLGRQIRNAWLYGGGAELIRQSIPEYVMQQDEGFRISEDELSAAIILRTWKILREQA